MQEMIQPFAAPAQTRGSNAAISGTSSILGVSLADIGMRVGDSQTVSWSGGAGDSITFSAIPEPASALFAGLGVIVLATTRRRRGV